MAKNIEDLDLEVKTFNRLKKAGISTVDELLAEMYSPGSKVSQPDAKRCEEVLKEHGIIRFMRGDEVEESDIEPEPLTWDELHSYIGKLVAHDLSTESHRWLKVCWIYDIQDEGEGNLIYTGNGNSYAYSRRSIVNGDYARHPSPFLKHEGQFFALKNPELPQPQESPVIVETAEYTRAVRLHRCICANAQAAQESLYEMCKALKEMHDQKLYRELGYSSFEDYTEKEVGIRKVQAYKYIAIGNVENVQLTERLGAEKLFLLAKLDEPQREKLQQTVNVEDVSVKELKAKIDDLKKANDRLMGKVAEAEDKAAMSRKSEEAACGKLSILRTDAEMKEQKIAQLTAKLIAEAARSAELENQVEELENRPVDVLIHNNDEEIGRLTAQFQEELEKRDKDTEQRLEQQREKYLKQMNEGIAKAREEAQAPDLHELWRALDNSLDNAIEAIEDFFDDYEDHPKIKDFANCLKTTIRDLNKLMNDVLAGKK